MEKELQDIKFKYPFRDYQQEALTMLNRYIYDKKIHIVAAPGAGKTILALELLLRIGNKALVLVPTIAIKEQWIERLTKDFINGNKADLISSELENPKVITIDTYQALYALKRKEKDINKIIIENNIKTIIFDEAHHLRKAWQKALKQITDELPDCTTISLTATPPYDSEKDFDNYMDLCGIIDAKITIPQLVKSNCLCPHQDFIYFNTPNLEQELELKEHTQKVNEFLNSLFNNKTLIKIIALHDYIVNTEENTNNILNEFEFFIAMLSFLKKVNYAIPKRKDLENLNVPKLNFSMLNIMLENLIFEKSTLEQDIFKEEIRAIKQELIELSCIDDDNNINLKYNKQISNLLTRNYEKLNSICEIIDIEKESLNEKLKLVIVTDYIKDEYYNIPNEEDIKELGVMPIFRKVTSKNPDVNVAVLTGTLTIIPTELKEQLLELAEKEYNIKKDEIKIVELGINFDYSKVEFESKHDRFKVNLITKLFKQSNISVLIGTIALIGEGWDAPFVNSLIMATYVSSYVTSNQLRGRAIRINKSDKNKFSNIWHLVCLESENDKYVLGYDYEILSKRFIAFEGIDIENKKIDSGIDRLNIYNKPYQKEEIKQLNDCMIEKSKKRKLNTEIWKNSIETYVPLTTEKIDISTAPEPTNIEIIKTTDKPHTSITTVKEYLMIILITSICILPILIYALARILPISDIILKVFLPIAIFIYAGKKLKEYMKYKIFRSYKTYVKIVCRAVYKSLIKKKIISRTTKYFTKINKNILEYGLKNSSTYEQMIFLKTVKESLSINNNSRYIVEFYDRVCSVPEQFNKNKSEANIFFNNIKVMKKHLIYTKTEKGKKILLKYKLQSLNMNE